MPPSPSSAEGSRLRRRVLVPGLALIALILAEEVYQGWQSHNASLQRGQEVIQLLSHASATQTEGIVQELDFALQDYADWFSQQRAPGLDAEALRARLVSKLARLPYVHSASVLDATGQRIATTDAIPTTGGSGRNFPYLEAMRGEQGAPLHIGRPWTSTRDGYRTFALSRRLTDPQGRFAGALVVRVSFDTLERSFEAVTVIPGARIALARDDGTVLAQYPDDPASQSPPGPSDLLAAATPLGRYPITVEVTRHRATVLANWRRQETGSAARTGLLVVLAATLLGAIVFSMKRREQAELARRESDARLEDARRAEALSLLAASVAHDFNNVLGAIVGFAELARDADTENSAVRSSLDRLLGAASRAHQLVRRVLTFDPHRSQRVQDVALAPIVREVLDQLQAQRTLTTVMRFDCVDDALTVRGDPTEVYQVVLNLCSNAVQAMPRGGSLAVTLEACRRDQPATLVVGNVDAGEYVRLSVKDSGPGIELARLQRIFDPLETSKPPAQGSGIGLTVVRALVDRMRGAVDVQTAAGEGSTFIVYWPRTLLAQGAVITQTPADPARLGRGETILIVDDDAQLASVLEELTASLGYEPVGVTDPLRALELLRATPDRFDLLITDEKMPGLHGLDLARSARDLAPSLPVLLVTGYRSADVDRVARELGIDVILDKPVKRDSLQRALARLLMSNEAGRDSLRFESIGDP